jgi:hypothetical protein
VHLQFVSEFQGKFCHILEFCFEKQIIIFNTRSNSISSACRYVDPHLPLSRYDWLESFCRHLLHDAAEGIFRSETFLGCGELLIPGQDSPDLRFMILTAHSVMVFSIEDSDKEGQGAEVCTIFCHDFSQLILLCCPPNPDLHEKTYTRLLPSFLNEMTF